jgi:crossover junction endodeoxyribonuclease RuvC
VKFLGIDPGITGAIAMLDGDTNEVELFDTPLVTIKAGKSLKNEMNAAQVALMMQSITAGKEAMVTIEKVQAMPGGGERTMGATSAFNFGKGFGIWLGIIAALQLPFEQVHPMTWKSAVLRGMPKEKDASRVRAMELFPKAAKHLSRKKDHGRADALLLAVYGKRCHENPMRVLERKVPMAEPTLFG